jgi:phosphoserine phosphatase
MRCIMAFCVGFRGRSMQRVDPVLVFDLDGTLLTVNSFPIWVLFLGFGGVRGLSIRVRLTVTRMVVRLLVLRKLGRMDHETFLRHMQALWHFATAGDEGAAAQRLGTLLLRYRRRNMAPVLKLVTDGTLDGVMATAAAEEYAQGLGRRLGLPNVVATPGGRGSDEPSNTGERKRQRLLAWLEERGWSGRPLIFFNDHMADVPLMRDSRIVCWFGSRRTLERAKRATPNVRFVACRGLREREMRATMAHLCQSVTVVQLQSYAG